MRCGSTGCGEASTVEHAGFRMCAAHEVELITELWAVSGLRLSPVGGVGQSDAQQYVKRRPCGHPVESSANSSSACKLSCLDIERASPVTLDDL